MSTSPKLGPIEAEKAAELRRRFPLGHAWAGMDYRRPGRVEISVEDDGAEAAASMTVRQARTLAIKLLAAAERAERRETSRRRVVATSEKAVALANQMTREGVRR